MASARPSVNKVDQLTATLRNLGIPAPQESVAHGFEWPHGENSLANCYLAIIAMCHQTSPIGERQLHGTVNGRLLRGWDYLKERYLLAAVDDPSWATADHWSTLRPEILSMLYADADAGLTLGRVNERTMLLNDIGRRFRDTGIEHIAQLFHGCGRMLGGAGGFMERLTSFVAYADPVRKKSHFFASVAEKECRWHIADPESLLSPVDYHELRGHLRIGTLSFADKALQRKVTLGLVLTEAEDSAVRRAVQDANNQLALQLGVSSSALHYLLWNFFRHWCTRDDACCHSRPKGPLPPPYDVLFAGHSECIFASICASYGSGLKPAEPPYAGHYY